MCYQENENKVRKSFALQTVYTYTVIISERSAKKALTCCLSCSACWAVSRLFSRLAFCDALAASVESSSSVFALSWWKACKTQIHLQVDSKRQKNVFTCLLNRSVPERLAGILSLCCLRAELWVQWLTFLECGLGPVLTAAESSAPGSVYGGYPGLACCSPIDSSACPSSVLPLRITQCFHKTRVSFEITAAVLC